MHDMNVCCSQSRLMSRLLGKPIPPPADVTHLQLALLVLEVLMQNLCLGRRGLHMQRSAMIIGSQLMQPFSLPGMIVPALAHKVVTSKGLLGLVRLGVLTHTAGFGVIMRRVGVQVEQILGCIFSNTQVTHRPCCSSTRSTDTLLDFAVTCIKNSGRAQSSDCPHATAK